MSANSYIPNCRQCGAKLRPFLYSGHADIDPRNTKKWGYNGNNIFCTLRCGFTYAVNSVKQGRE